MRIFRRAEKVNENRDLITIVELAEAGLRRANQLLEAGYSLIDLGSVTFEANRRSYAPGAPTTYVRHDFRYIIARRKGQVAFPAPEPWRPAEVKVATGDGPGEALPAIEASIERTVAGVSS